MESEDRLRECTLAAEEVVHPKEHEMVKLKGPVETSSSQIVRQRTTTGQRQEGVLCAWTLCNHCPEKTVEIHHINVGPVYTADAKVGCRITKVILDSGTRKSMFPSKLNRFPQVHGVEDICSWSSRRV